MYAAIGKGYTHQFGITRKAGRTAGRSSGSIRFHKAAIIGT